MTETVDQNAQEMIPELDQLEKLRIFAKNEIRIIVKKRKAFEGKIQRRVKCEEDYMNFIQYEVDVLRIVRARCTKLGITQNKKSEVEIPIARRINKLFKQAMVRFPDDLDLCFSYMKFCQQVKFFSCDRSVLVRMVRVHGHKPGFWKKAASWEFEENKSVENARQFLLRGLRLHPDSRILYTEAFRLELSYADLMRKEKESEGSVAPQLGRQEAEAERVPDTSDVSSSESPTSTSTPMSINQSNVGEGQEVAVTPESSFTEGVYNTDQILEGHLAEVMYESASKRIPDCSFLVSLLKVAQKFKFTDKLQKKITTDLLTRFIDDELAWDAMARCELEGLASSFENSSAEVVPDSKETVQGSDEPVTKSTNKNKSNLKERIQRCSAVYQFAIRRLPTEKMWSMYLEALLDMNKDQVHYPNVKKKLLGSTFQNAHNSGLMHEKYYLHWVSLLGEKQENPGRVLRIATDRFPLSSELWHKRLQFHLSSNELETAMSVFKSAVASLGSNNAGCVPLWKMLILFWQLKSTRRVEQLFRDGVKQGPNVSSTLKPMFLEWLALSKGIRDAREAYQSLSKQAPYCLSLHQKMGQLECLQIDINLSRVRKCYEVACDQFGSDNTHVWIEYIKFEQKKGDPKKVGTIHCRALKNLKENLVDNFVSEFCLVNTGLSKPFDGSVLEFR